LGNHDKPRFGSRYGTERVDGLLVLLLTLPGVAVTYNGDEIGMLDYRDISWDKTLDPQACNTNDPNNYKDASRDPQRTPFQWDSSAYAGFKTASGQEPWVEINPNYRTLNLAAQKTAAKSFYKLFTSLAKLRNDEVFVKGSFETYAFNDDVFSYKRTYGAKSYVILINFSSKEYTLNINDLNVAFSSDVEVVLAGSRSSYSTGLV
jgi:alpha-glucosidase